MQKGQLRQRFLEFLNRSDCTTAQADEFINDAIRRIQRELRLPSMERIADMTVGSAFQYFPLPEDVIEIIGFSGDGLPLNRVPLRVYQTMKANKLPQAEAWCRNGPVIFVAGQPKPGSTLTLHYYGEFMEMVADADENELARTAPDVIIYGALSEAAHFFSHEMGPVWEQRYQAIAGTLINQAIMDEFSGGPLAMEMPAGAIY
ncbi:hypothetical protein GAY31_11385 [Azospirillum brasilense]|nr:hypothetical protein [Azospirillum brasilense]